MTRTLLAALALLPALLTASCDVTGTAAPSGAAAHVNGANQIGDPGFGAP